MGSSSPLDSPQSALAGLDIAGVRCDEVHQPRSVEAAAELLALAARERRRLAFVGGGTALGLGNAPNKLDAVVLTRSLNRVIEYAPEDQVIVAEAGVVLSDLQALAAQHGQWLGVDAPDAARATLGGLVAVGAYGPRRARYGSIRDLLLGVTLVRADGVVAKGGSKVVKNVAGFDLPKLMCGSLGTLGLVATVTLRLHPLPEASATLGVRETSAAGLVELTRALRQAQLEPSSLVALRTESGRYELGIRCEGFAQGVERDVARAAEVAAASGAHPLRLGDSDAAAFWKRHELARTDGELRFRIQTLPTGLERLDELLLPPLLGALSQPRFAWYPSSGIGFGSGRVREQSAALAALGELRAAAVRGRGALIVEAAPVELRPQLDAWGPDPGALPLMQELKRRFDPDHRLNPGRFVGGI